MRLFTLFSLVTILICVKGQPIQAPTYSCNTSNSTVQFTFSSLAHSAWQPISNCSLQQCYVSSTTYGNCRSSLTPCFDYRTYNKSRYCAPGILCSLIEPCNSTTYICASNTSVCVVNSCCSSKAVCLPLPLTTFCPLDGSTTIHQNMYFPS